jgi:murein DD-endopeptidase MepM/ murein hydrolase activator NlpD
VAFIAFSLSIKTPVFAQEAKPCSEQLKRARGEIIINCSGSNVCVATPTAANNATPAANGSSIYVLGDSITVLSKDEITELIAASPKGFTISKINSDGGRAITYDSFSDVPEPAGIESVSIDASIIQGSDVVVIALGTNSGNEDLSVQIPALITAVRDTGFSGKIFWVDMFFQSDTEERDNRNSVIESLHEPQVYTVIHASEANIELEPTDQIHPTTAGQATFAKRIVDTISATPAVNTKVQATNEGLCQCATGTSAVTINTTITWGEGVWGSGATIYRSGLSGPFTLEQWAIHVLKNIARKTGISEDQLVTEDKVVSLLAWARAEGGGVNGHNGKFNPLNTKLAHDDLQGVNEGNAATDSNSQGYPSFDFGVEAITRGLFGKYQKRIGSAFLQPTFPQDALIEAIAGDFYSPDGSSVVNRLESIYPGDLPYATFSITGFDYGGGIGDRDLYVSALRDTLTYVRQNYATYAATILDGSPAGEVAPLVFNPSGSTTGTSNTANNKKCSQSDLGGGTVQTNGYAFPLEPQTRDGISGIHVGQTFSEHHDGTDAYDLMGPVDADVYAIYAGTPVRINTLFNNVPGCSSIQFKADDGFYYWYGHLKNVVVQEGVHIDAGVKMAEVADLSFGSTCYGGTPHLHIDRGCTTADGPQTGGRDECRDPEFIPFLSKLYEELP